MMIKRKILQKLVTGTIMFLLFTTSFTLAQNIKTSVSQKNSTTNNAILKIIIEGNCAIIKNIGDVDAVNVRWELQLKCRPLLLISPGKQSGSFDRIEAGNDRVVCYNMSNSIIYGFGVLKLKATANADNARETKAMGVIGFLLGPLILTIP